MTVCLLAFVLNVPASSRKVGAGLLAKEDCQSTLMLDVMIAVRCNQPWTNAIANDTTIMQANAKLRFMRPTSELLKVLPY
jgi:hypothetical protein